NVFQQPAKDFKHSLTAARGAATQAEGMEMEKREQLYSGKAKSVYTTDDPNFLILHFRNDTSAFDGKKIAQPDRKGMVNNKFNAFIMEKLEAAGVPTHFEKLLSDEESLVKRLT